MTPPRILVLCRAFGHAWDTAAPDLRFARPSSGHSQPARCDRCTSFRFQWLGWDGKPVSTWYDLTDAYLEVARSLTRGEAKVWLIEHQPRRRREVAL